MKPRPTLRVSSVLRVRDSHRRSYKTQSAFDALTLALSPLLRQKGLAHTRLLSSWRDIVDDERLASLSCIDRLDWGRKPSPAAAESSTPLRRRVRLKNVTGGGTLFIRAAPEIAPELQMMSELLKNRVNALLGFALVRRVRVRRDDTLSPSASSLRRHRN